MIRRNVLTALVVSVCLLPSHAAITDALKEVLQLHSAGLGDDTVISFIQSRNDYYGLSAQDVLWLRDQGLSSSVINSLLLSGKGAASVTAPPGPTTPPPPPPEGPPSQPPVSVAQPVAVTEPTIIAQPAISPEAAYFYQELSPYGGWILIEDGQWYWQPTVATISTGWRPYWDRGRWVYTDHGWYWASDYSWGWAAFHYGRWRLHPHHGWIWYPDRVWAPAWVTWRAGGDYCGWAPLPPQCDLDEAAGGFIYHGRHVDISFSFGLDWHDFSFCFLRDLGSRPRARFRQDQEVRNVYNQTTIINNYTVQNITVNNEPQRRIMNHGIDPQRVAAARGKSIETVKIEDRRTPSPTRTPERLDTRARTLEVYRPQLAVARPGPAPTTAVAAPGRSQPVAITPRERTRLATPPPAQTLPTREQPRTVTPSAASPRAVEPARTAPGNQPERLRPGTPAATTANPGRGRILPAERSSGLKVEPGSRPAAPAPKGGEVLQGTRSRQPASPTEKSEDTGKRSRPKE